MEKKDILLKKRAAIKGQLTRFKTFIQNTIHSEQVDNQILLQVNSRLENTQTLLHTFNEIQLNIDHIDNVDSTAEYENFEDSYYEAITLAKQFISEANNTSQAKTDPPQGSSSPYNDTPIQLNNVKLPTVQLPAFMGSYENWSEFHDTFHSMIDSNPHLSDVQKFYYLKSSLKQDAAQVIQSLEVNDINYRIAWDLLKERYDNTRLIIHNHIKTLFNLPSVGKESHVKLRLLLDTVQKHLRCLETLKQPTQHWDTLIIYLITARLDPTTMRAWESFNIEGTLPTMNDMKSFLKSRCEVLEKLNINFEAKGNNPPTHSSNKQHAFISNEVKCPVCNNDHAIYKCAKFLELTPDNRIIQVKQLRLCINCLRPGHFSKDCRSSACKRCSRKHSTLLHLETILNANTNTTNLALSSQIKINTGLSQVLLSTVKVNVKDKFGKMHLVRVLLDSGSQSNFVTSKLVKALNLPTNSINLCVSGINQTQSNITLATDIKLYSYKNSFSSTISCLVIPKICDQLPSFSFNPAILNIPQNITLSDPDFNKSNEIDILIGAKHFWELLCVGQIQLGPQLPTLQKTRFGWTISGSIYCNNASKITHCNFVTRDLDIHNQLEKFWSIEELPKAKARSIEEQECEAHFVKNVTRNPEGRFVVSLPFKESVQKLGDSKATALRRFYSLENKFKQNHTLYSQYDKFMKEYESLGHMTKDNNSNSKLEYFLPHHGVFKQESITTKLRVVFDGSTKSTSGYSINDLQMVGPTIQDELFTIILRFRKHQFVISADIAKMYRQVLVAPEDRQFQKILWRSNPTEILNTYNLNTVTYGTASASYLSVRCLQQLSFEYCNQYPKASEILAHDFYVDDLLTGSNSIEEVFKICKDLEIILRSGGFELRKWRSNNNLILENIQNFSTSNEQVLIIGQNDNDFKTLGLFWKPQTDSLMYDIKHTTHAKSVTKRYILSCIAQIYDPLGLLSPTTVIAKIMLQKLWQHKTSWDEAITLDLYTKWRAFEENLHALNEIQIPRHVICKEFKSIELHGFSDASEEAYGACIYIRSIDEKGNICVELLCAKTRVAPLKSLSIPRLELCGAFILSKLIKRALDSLNLNFDKQYLWTDSTIVLAWINTEPNKLKTFVANRISEIQTLTNVAKWNHIGTKDNPADLLSRGVYPKDLGDQTLWWHGPPWLSLAEDRWPVNKVNILEVEPPEMKAVQSHNFVNNISCTYFEKYSSLTKLQRVIAYCKRFISNCKRVNKQFGHLTKNELDQSLLTLIKISQRESFPQEVISLTKPMDLHRQSKLISLAPFLDDLGLIRVGGRLNKSNLEYNKKHPIVLPAKHILTKMIIKHEHIRCLHVGAQSLLGIIRENYWPINARNLVKGVIRNCVQCFKANPKSENPLMGDLPESPLVPARPFLNCGVDYAGPFTIKDRKGRGAKLNKVYICLFICFSVKAIHVELVTDLTTEAFLAAFRRFVSRRGKPLNIYSDNGTNFVGANNEIIKLSNFLKNDSKLAESLAGEGVSWHFIPARSPHFGGLWESGVKSVKSHMKRVIGNALLTYEQMITILTQIEAVLNSRPLYPMSNDPNDTNPITPAHFLIGSSLTSLPDSNVMKIPDNRLSAFQRCQQILQHFWSRWSTEYIAQLQQRVKWRTNNHHPVKVGELALIRDETAPPLRWHLGRIVELFPGTDRVVRVVSLKTLSGVVKRPVTKICVLPYQFEEHK